MQTLAEHHYFFFSLIPRRPPTPTLFPYTTLFRSAIANRPRDVGPRQGGDGGHAPPRRDDVRSPDRKSTRLNSSHRCISYAVFCLKKKKKNTHHLHVHRSDAEQHILCQGVARQAHF